MFQVTVEGSPKEEVADLLDSPGWDRVVDIVAADCISSRRVLLTSANAPNREHHVAKLQAYMNLFESTYTLAGRKLPRKYRELFTGSEE